MKVFAYLRVSTKEQLDGGGYDRQLDAIKVLCAHRGWTIARTFKDQQSGGTEFDNRTGLHDILALAGGKNALGVDTVVVENASRVARDLIVQEVFLSECRKREIKVFCADTGEEIVMADADPSRVMMRQIFGAVAQWEKSMLVLKLQAGRRRTAAKTGKPCGGPQPYGQTDAERAVLADIRKMRNQQRKTFLEIANALSDIGYPTPTGGNLWQAATVHKLWRRGEDSRNKEMIFILDNDQ